MDARLVIFHAVPPLPTLLYGIDPFTQTELVAYGRSARKSAAHKMAALEKWFKKRCPNTRMALHEGPAAENILKTAGKVHADYIVLGSHGHGAMYDLLVGSTAHIILKKSPCPVVLVPNSSQPRPRKKSPRSFASWPPWIMD